MGRSPSAKSHTLTTRTHKNRIPDKTASFNKNITDFAELHERFPVREYSLTPDEGCVAFLSKEGNFPMDAMTVTVNFWFLFSMCLIFLVIGLIIGVQIVLGAHSRRDRGPYRY
jgi:hypothetical protein